MPSALLLVLALPSCQPGSDRDTGLLYEGDERRECTDGADNDRDGLFDCDDPGCAGSPDCEEADTDADADADTDTDTDTDADTDTSSPPKHPPPEIHTVEVDYNEKAWVYDIVLNGWGSRVKLDVAGSIRSIPWEEAHDLDLLEYDPDYVWSRFGLTPPIVVLPEDHFDSLTTLFPGDADTASRMTWMATAYDEYGVQSDCVSWGFDVGLYSRHKCREISPARP